LGATGFVLRPPVGRFFVVVDQALLPYPLVTAMYSSLFPANLLGVPPKKRLATLVAARPLVTRVAPSPTGFMHVGTMRVALHNALAASASGGRFLLRIDDTDDNRNRADAVDLIHSTLDRLGLIPAQHFHQSDRRIAHQDSVQRLLDAGWAVRDQGAVRLAPHARDLAPTSFFDLTTGVVPISSTWLDHADGLVLLRQDGTPTYHLASIVDDMDYGINLVLRGMDHQANTAKQLILALALKHAGHPGAPAFCDQVLFGHCGLLMYRDKKLSKRDPDSDGRQWLDRVGPSALHQGLLTLGWGHPNPQFDRQVPSMTWDDLVSVFPQGCLRSSNCRFDPDKLLALARKHHHRGAA
jgi:glutamyl-tRNA synthetase